MKYKFEYVNDEYTGGGIYVYSGKLESQDLWFVASDAIEEYGIRLLTDMPEKCDGNGEVIEDYTGDAEWQDKHLFCDLDGKAALQFAYEMFSELVRLDPKDSDAKYRRNDVWHRLNEIYTEQESKPYKEWFDFVSQSIDNMDDDDAFTITFRGRTIKYGLSPASYEGMETFISNILEDIKGEY